MHEELRHLTAEKIKELRQRYYRGEKTSSLIEEYGIAVHPNNLYKSFPPEEVEEYCEYCGTQFVRDCVSKSAYRWRKDDDIYCPMCRHKPHTSCKCASCVRKERQLEEDRRQQIEALYSHGSNRVNFTELSFEQKAFLGALCRALLKEDLSEIKPYIGSNTILAPTDKLCREIYETLIQSGVITVSPSSPLTAFGPANGNFPNVYDVLQVTYRLNLADDTNKGELFDEILNPTYYCVSYEDEALKLWKKIAVSECLEYLELQLKKVGFPFNPGEKTYKMFDILLDDFSVSQIYGIIWRAVADASKLYLERERGMTRKHAANTVIGTCERYAARAKANGWTLNEYNRPLELPQSELSSFYYNRVLGIGDKGFKKPPTAQTLLEDSGVQEPTK